MYRADILSIVTEIMTNRVTTINILRLTIHIDSEKGDKQKLNII